ncbi:hypothetical protein SAMN06265378_103140 [Paracoccus sediminis]|uniref:Uncharacterized protein n=1 Tax=Paracoccus sediminis TaxID=1214787 RepID=A0A238VYC1_9RHOB|nr:hypothetical protein SAMN06265378_103140 [Paracoccus sediminis]
MIRTIAVGSHILIQGLFECLAPNGNMVVRIGTRTFEGRPVTR